MKWSTAEARGNLSRLLQAADEEPQVITNRGRPVAVVIDAKEYETYLRWRKDHPPRSIGDALDELRQVCESEDYTLQVPRRRDRPNPMVEVGDDFPG